MPRRTPFDIARMMGGFGAAEMPKMMAPARVFPVFEAETPPRIDMMRVMAAHRRNFDAMVAANKSAATLYRELLSAQIDACVQFTAAAREQAIWPDATAGSDAVARQTEAYGAALTAALEMMQQVSDSAHAVNQEARAALQERLQETLDEVRKRGADD